MGAGLGLDDTLHHDFADRVSHDSRNTFRVRIHTKYLTLIMKGCSFLEKFEQGTQTVLQKGALL